MVESGLELGLLGLSLMSFSIHPPTVGLCTYSPFDGDNEYRKQFEEGLWIDTRELEKPIGVSGRMELFLLNYLAIWQSSPSPCQICALAALSGWRCHQSPDTPSPHQATQGTTAV